MCWKNKQIQYFLKDYFFLLIYFCRWGSFKVHLWNDSKIENQTGRTPVITTTSTGTTGCKDPKKERSEREIIHEDKREITHEKKFEKGNNSWRTFVTITMDVYWMNWKLEISESDCYVRYFFIMIIMMMVIFFVLK